MSRAIVLNQRDNVATLIDSGRASEVCELQGDGPGEVRLRQDIAFGHKVAIAAIPRGADVVKYGQVIGTASSPISPGEHAHTHNIESRRRTSDLVGR